MGMYFLSSHSTSHSTAYYICLMGMTPIIKPNDFKFTYLHDYARYLRENQLREFVLVGIRFSREAELPLLKKLTRFTEDQLVELGLESNKQMLLALSSGTYAEYLEANSKKWIDNTLGYLQRDEIMVEDLTIGYYIRRRIFTHFLDVYTKNVVLQKLIIAEVDQWSSKEELYNYTIYLNLQQNKLILANKELEFHKQLLLEAQELSAMGSFTINMKEREKSYFSPEYQKIFEFDNITTFEKFIQWVHPEDSKELMIEVERVYAQGGIYDVNYRYNKSGREKRIWSRGFVVLEDGKPALLRGVAREIE